MLNHWIHQALGIGVTYGEGVILPIMCFGFVIGIAVRWVIYFTVKCEYSFALEFEKRVFKQLTDADRDPAVPFHRSAKYLLEQTFYEHFEMKRKYKRRRWDHITTITDRLFLIEIGAQRLMKDTLSQTKYLRKGGRDPKFLDISKYVFNANPVFNRLFGIVPLSTFHDVINLLPGLFVVGGIFGTFLGIMQGLPGLSNIDVTNVETTKKMMDVFLLKMASSMSASVLGIFFSVIVTIINTLMSPEGMYVNMVNKFTSSLEFLWNESLTNELTEADLEDLTEKGNDPRDPRNDLKQQLKRTTVVQPQHVPTPVPVAPPSRRAAAVETAAATPAPMSPTPAPPPPIPAAVAAPPPKLRKPLSETVEVPRPDKVSNQKQLGIKLKIVEKALETNEQRRSTNSDEHYRKEKLRLETERNKLVYEIESQKRQAA